MESYTNTSKRQLAYRDNLFKGKVLLLTGGTSKMLYQVAEDFMRLGGSVALVSRKLKLLEDIAQELKKQTGGKAKGYKLDLKKHQEAENVVDEIIKDFGRIDVLVNGAAGNFLADAENLSINGFKTVIDIDTVGTFQMCKTVYSKWMKKNGGNIVNISMTLHYLGTLMQAHSCAAKAAVDALTKVLALEWGPKGVRVNGVAPGPIEGTEGLDRLSDLAKSNSKNNLSKSSLGGKEVLSNMSSYIPLQRLGTRIDVSNAVLFLASDLSSYMTGQNVVVDGGSLAIMPNWLPFSPDYMKSWTAKF